MSIFISQTCPPKPARKSAFYLNNWNAAAGQWRLWRHWKLLGMKVLIKHFKESGLPPETMLRTHRCRLFPKPEKSLIFGISAKGAPHEFFWKASLLQRAESDIFHVEWGADDNGAMEKWLWLIFGELWAFLSPKFALQNCLKKCFLPQQLECRCGPTAAVTSLKVTWHEGPDQALQGKRLSFRNYAAYAT